MYPIIGEICAVYDRAVGRKYKVGRSENEKGKENQLFMILVIYIWTFSRKSQLTKKKFS